ncbi:vam6/Vps39-like protein [Watersipora subatra]|uniref:vam6/Vps39-like protein n=1 Tax=Watersipora subatra TaxID=2589382 RepID=UPI00355ACDD7
MHGAYEAGPIIEKLPYPIESISAYDDKLIVGTKNGFALVYHIESKGSSACEVSLDHAYKTFSKKPVLQLEAIPELDILVSLSDNAVAIHELGSLKLLTDATQSLNQTRGANVFAIHVQVLTNIHGDKQCTLKLCVAVRKRLYLYYWKNSTQIFHELRPGADIALPDIPKVLCWCRNSICVGFKREYYMYEVDPPNISEVFPTGRNQEPLMASVGGDRLALNKDNISVLIDHKKQPTQKYGINWSEAPVAMVYRAPYLIGVLPRYVEVRTIEPKHMIQTIALDKPRILTHTRDGSLYIASVQGVWRLAYLPVSMQIDQLISNKEFELALLLSDTDSMENDDSRHENSRRLHTIKNLHAFELFSQKRYEDSIRIFSDLKTDPSHVIGLYPDLLPRDFRVNIKYPRHLPDLTGADREQALAALIDYLTLKRMELLKQDKSVKTVDVTPLMTVSKDMSNSIVKTRKQLSQIIDTTLLKCYLEINDALVAPLLRLKDNNCHVEESEKVLKKSDKLDELIILYETRQQHTKALKMLMEQSQKKQAPDVLKGVERTIGYLQRLGKEHVDTILEYADWVIKADPRMGLCIFTDELLEKKQRLPVGKVVAFLGKQVDGTKLVISYLEHVISVWGETNSDHHDKLVMCYKDVITPLLKEYITSLPEGQIPASAGTEDGDLGYYRAELVKFLSSSTHYRPERLIKIFPYDYYYEERAILLGRCGHHRQALFIYVHLLQRVDLAEDYCRQYYDKNVAGRCDVYIHLLGYYLRPAESLIDAKELYGTRTIQNMTANTESAIKLLKLHSNKLDSRKVLELLPADFSLYEMLPYLEKIIENGESQKRENMVLRNLLSSEKLVVERARILQERTKFTVTERSLCSVCQNKISTSSFVRQPSGDLAHIGCLKEST